MKHLFQSLCRRVVPALFVATLLAGGNAATAQVMEPVTVIHSLNGNTPLVIPATDASAPKDYLITGTWNGAGRPVIIRSNFRGTVTLKDVYIKATGDYWTAGNMNNVGNAIDIEDNAYVTLKLMGNSVLDTPSVASAYIDWHPATLHVSQNAHLTIESYDGVDEHGTLTAVAGTGRSGAAIGGNLNTASIGAANASISGYITINSGTVIATGGDDSAGIGGSSFSGAGGHITINGGIVRATCDATTGGANSGAAIGSGFACRNTYTYITITGGNVTAVSLITDGNSLCGAAIGAGNANGYTTTTEGNFGYILITGGTIKASVRGRYALDGTYSGDIYLGRDGVAIGGGARANAQGTIIILPSADVSELHGGATYYNGTLPGWDIGNCDKIFYLNKSDPWVAVGNSTRVHAKSFTARLNPAKAGAQIYARIAEANTFDALSSVASLVDTIPSSGVIGLTAADKLYYHTNSLVDFFTNAEPDNPLLPYEIKTFPTFLPVPIPTQSDNPDQTRPYDVVIGTSPTPTYDFKLSYGWEVEPTPASPIIVCDQTEIPLDFYSAEYDRYGPKLTPGSDSIKAFSIENTGTGWLDITFDPSSVIRYFTLDGPVVSDPAVEGGAHLPVGTRGVITATLKNQVPVGNLVDTLVLKAVAPDGTVFIRKVFLRINVTQKLVGQAFATNEAKMTAKNPPEGGYTNSTVRLTARANAADIDGVMHAWYKIVLADNTTGYETGNIDGYLPAHVTGWKSDTATVVGGKYGYNFLLGDKPFEYGNGTYYIHWFVETVNTAGSRSSDNAPGNGGVLGPFYFNNDLLEPTITGQNTIGLTPVTLTLTFPGNWIDPAGGDPIENMFSVAGGRIVSSSISYIAGEQYYKYTFQVEADAPDQVTVTFAQNRVKDIYGNRNQAATKTLTVNNGLPFPDFSLIDSAYFTPPTSVTFNVESGITGDPELYLSGGTTQITTNAQAASTYTITKAGSPFSHSLAFATTSEGGEYPLTGTFSEGEYNIIIIAGDILNKLSNGIADTTHTFRVYDLAVTASPGVDFGVKNEGYSVPPATFTIQNLGSLTATGLVITLDSGDVADYVLNTAPMQTTLPGGSQTVFTVMPRAGLLTRPTPYATRVRVWSNGNEVKSFTVTFRVTKLPPPHAEIDYVNETLTELHPDSAYVFNNGAPVTPTEDGETGIPDSWMTGVANGLTNSSVDPDNGGALSAPQLITVPRRPAAPAATGKSASAPSVNDGVITGVNDSMEYRFGDDGEWIPVPANNTWLEDLRPGMYYVRYPASQADQRFASYVTTIAIGENNMPILLREVLIPETPGIMVLPHAGVHYVQAENELRFTLLFAGDVPPTVETDRTVDGVRERLTGVDNGAGGYDYVIPTIRETVRVTITPGAVGNAAIGGTAAWAFGGTIYIEAADRTTVDVYTVGGMLIRRLTVAAGITAIPAAQGVYVIALPGGATQKVVVQ